MASVRLNQLSAIVPMSASENGTSHPPRPKPPLGSSSAPPGPCMIPSSVRNVWTTSFKSDPSPAPGRMGSQADDGVLAPVSGTPRAARLRAHRHRTSAPGFRDCPALASLARKWFRGLVQSPAFYWVQSCRPGRDRGSVGYVDLEVEFQAG